MNTERENPVDRFISLWIWIIRQSYEYATQLGVMAQQLPEDFRNMAAPPIPVDSMTVSPPS